MTERIIPASQQAMYDNFHFAPGIRTGDLLIMSGQVGMDASGKCPDDVAEQFRLAFENIGEILAEAGGDRGNDQLPHRHARASQGLHIRQR